MTDPNPTTDVLAPPKILGGDELYNKIMGSIEPDLTTMNLPTLDEKYAGESDENRIARMNRYKVAFVEYQKKFQEHQNIQQAELRSFKNGAMKFVERKSETSDEDALGALESSINNL